MRQIAENGPLLQYAQTIFERAIDEYWRENIPNGKQHFLFNTEDIRSYICGASKVMGKLMDQILKLFKAYIFTHLFNTIYSLTNAICNPFFSQHGIQKYPLPVTQSFHGYTGPATLSLVTSRNFALNFPAAKLLVFCQPDQCFLDPSNQLHRKQKVKRFQIYV